jgi:hypothetical protein
MLPLKSAVRANIKSVKENRISIRVDISDMLINIAGCAVALVPPAVIRL